MVVSLFSFPISRRPRQEFLGWNGGTLLMPIYIIDIKSY